MTTKTAKTIWKGDFQKGTGKTTTPSGILKNTTFSYSARFENEKDSSPEELIAAAHSTCYSMFLSEGLEKAGYRVEQVVTEDKVTIEKEGTNYKITKIDISSEATVLDDIEQIKFSNIAEEVKKNCPVSKILAGAEIALHATVKTTQPVEHINGN